MFIEVIGLTKSVSMKRNFTFFVTLILSLLLSAGAKAQLTGRVLLNEYLPWPNNVCGATAEMVELYNMGPGPVNIGCYVLTDGDFSVTIPANTWLQPGQFYVISGQSLIPAPCANIARNIVADLNWNTCGCTNAPIPMFAPGFFTDGGFANEQMVLLDPMGKVVDAVVRALPVEASSTITSKALGTCKPFTFNLGTMGIEYETIGESAGRGNSIARKLDGDCGWVKDTQQTGGETNNTPGARSPFTLSMFITEDPFCMFGSARFVVDQNPASFWFPVDYILAYDADGDGMFTWNDTYTNGIDYSAPDLVIDNLPFGLYSINIGPKQGCSYQNFTFAIGPCTTLGYSIRSFTVNHFNDFQMFAQIVGADQISGVILEGSEDGKTFMKIDDVSYSVVPGIQDIQFRTESTNYTFFRLALFNREGKTVYSPIRKLSASAEQNRLVLAGNPVRDEVRFYSFSNRMNTVELQVFNTAGQVITSRKYTISSGNSVIQLPVAALTPGSYIIKANLGNGAQQTFRVIKQ